MTFDWPVVWANLPLLLQGADDHRDPDRRHHGAGDPGRAPARCASDAPLAPIRARGHCVRRVLPGHAADPADLLGLLRPAGVLRHPLFANRRPRSSGWSCNISSFNSETFRAGIISIRQGQWNAGLALGMSVPQVFCQIVLPQAVMRVLPALASTWVSLFKDTSLVSVIAVADLSYVALKLARRDLPHPRGPDGDGGALLADGLSAGQARRLDPPPLQGGGMNAASLDSGGRGRGQELRPTSRPGRRSP